MIQNKLQYTLSNSNNLVIFGKAEYHLGDLEKRHITYIVGKDEGVQKDESAIILHKNGITHNKHKTKSEILWFASLNRSSIRKVFISFRVKRVSDIDNVNEEYKMRFQIEFHWIPTVNDYINYIKYINNNNLKEYIPQSFMPRFTFENAITVRKSDWVLNEDIGAYFYMVNYDNFAQQRNQNKKVNEYDSKYCKFIKCKMQFDVTFAEELELQSFPFDCQDLTCIIVDNGQSKYELLPELRDNRYDFASVDPSCSIMDEWDLDAATLEFADIDHDENIKLIFRLKMKRRYFAILTNIMTPIAVLNGISLSTYSLHAENEIIDRLTLNISILLSVVGFQFIISGQLPNVPYLTLIDKYVLFSYLILAFNSIESAFGKFMLEENDQFVMMFACLMWLIFQIMFIFYAVYIRKDETRKLNMMTNEIEDQVNFEKEELNFDVSRGTLLSDSKSEMKYIWSTENENEKDVELIDKNKKTQ